MIGLPDRQTVMEDGTMLELLALVESPGHVCCRYRIAAYEHALRSFGVRITYEAIESNIAKRFHQMKRAARYDSVILQRKLIDAYSLSILRKSARHLVFDFDDAVVYRDSYSPKGHFDAKRSSRFHLIASRADVVLAGNSFLASLAEEHGAKSSAIHYMPTCVDFNAYQATRARTPKRNDDRFVMVWIGSSSTLKGLEATSQLWENIGHRVPNAVLRVVCDRFPDFRHLEVEQVRWSQETEIEEIVTADIGISHVPNDLWSRGKCGLKVLQYLAGGIPVLTNPVGVHQEMIKPGTNGFLVNRPEEWFEAVRWLGQNRDAAHDLGTAGLETIRNGYDIADWGPIFVDRVMPGAVPLDWSREAASRSAAGNPSQSAGRVWKQEPESNHNGPHQDARRGIRK